MRDRKGNKLITLQCSPDPDEPNQLHCKIVGTSRDGEKIPVQLNKVLPPDGKLEKDEKICRDEGCESKEPQEDPVDLIDDQLDEEKNEKCGAGCDDNE